MEATLLYFAKMILCSGVLFLYYQLFLKDKTFHHYNRFYLVGVLLISLVLPLLKVDYFTIEVDSSMYVLLSKFQNFNTANTENHDYIYFQYAAYALGLVSIFFLAKLGYGIVKIIQFKNAFREENIQGIKFYQTNLLDAPFSFFRNLFWKDTILLQSDLGRQILKHEMVHIEQKHSIDKLVAEVLVAAFWFNPFFYIIKKEISLIHEYLADKKSVRNSDTKAFAQMLLASHFSGKVLPATSPFLSSNLKKRLKMLQKSKTKYSYARRLFALPILFLMAFTYLVNAKNKEIEATNKEVMALVQEITQSQIGDTTKLKSPTVELIELETNKIKQEQDKVHLELQKLQSDTKGNSDLNKTMSSNLADSMLGKLPVEKFQGKVNRIYINGVEMDTVVVKKYFGKYTNDDDVWKVADANDVNVQLLLKDLSKKNAAGEAVKWKDELLKASPEDQAKLFKRFLMEHEAKSKEMEKVATEVRKTATGEAQKSNFYRLESVFFDDGKQREKLTKKEQKKLDELNKKQKQLAEQQAQLAKERAKLLKTDKYFSNSFSYSLIPKDAQQKSTAKAPLKTESALVLNGKGVMTEGSSSIKNDKEPYTKITIDGKSASQQELQDLDPKKIDRMYVYKNTNGQKSNEIEVVLKK